MGVFGWEMREIEKIVGPNNFLFGSPKFNLPNSGRKLD